MRPQPNAPLIARALSGEINPKVTVLRGPQLDGVDHGRTTAPGPMREILALADQLVEEHGLLSASVNAGFPWADVDYVGPTVIVVADADNPDAMPRRRSCVRSCGARARC